MYSRYHNRRDEPVRVPEHYGGTAFSERPQPPEPPHRLNVARPTPPEETPMPAPPHPARPPRLSETLREPPVTLSCDTCKAPEAEKPLSILPPLAAKGFPFGHGIGSEELLLIGLIVLLSGSEGGSDMVLWLALLLFLG